MNIEFEREKRFWPCKRCEKDNEIFWPKGATRVFYVCEGCIGSTTHPENVSQKCTYSDICLQDIKDNFVSHPLRDVKELATRLKMACCLLHKCMEVMECEGINILGFNDKTIDALEAPREVKSL